MKFDPSRWYFKTYVYVAAFLCIGPLALPLVWVNPRYNMAKKITITVISLVISYLLVVILSRSIDSITKYYQQILQLSR